MSTRGDICEIEPSAASSLPKDNHNIVEEQEVIGRGREFVGEVQTIKEAAMEGENGEDAPSVLPGSSSTNKEGEVRASKPTNGADRVRRVTDEKDSKIPGLTTAMKYVDSVKQEMDRAGPQRSLDDDDDSVGVYIRYDDEAKSPSDRAQAPHAEVQYVQERPVQTQPYRLPAKKRRIGRENFDLAVPVAFDSKHPTCVVINDGDRDSPATTSSSGPEEAYGGLNKASSSSNGMLHHRRAPIEVDGLSSAAAALSRASTSSKNRFARTCTNCNQPGHDRRNCNKPRLDSKGFLVVSQRKCTRCGSLRHDRRTCPQLNGSSYPSSELHKKVAAPELQFDMTRPAGEHYRQSFPLVQRGMPAALPRTAANQPSNALPSSIQQIQQNIIAKGMSQPPVGSSQPLDYRTLISYAARGPQPPHSGLLIPPHSRFNAAGMPLGHDPSVLGMPPSSSYLQPLNAPALIQPSHPHHPQQAQAVGNDMSLFPQNQMSQVLQPSLAAAPYGNMIQRQHGRGSPSGIVYPSYPYPDIGPQLHGQPVSQPLQGIYDSALTSAAAGYHPQLSSMLSQQRNLLLRQHHEAMLRHQGNVSAAAMGSNAGQFQIANEYENKTVEQQQSAALAVQEQGDGGNNDTPNDEEHSGEAAHVLMSMVQKRKR